MSQPHKPHEPTQRLFRVLIKVRRPRAQYTRQLKQTSTPYKQHLAESKARNQRIFERYGAVVYKSEFDRLYGRDLI